MGVSGSGRQSLARLAAYLTAHELVQFAMAKAYSVADWRDDLKKLLRGAGDGGRPTVRNRDTRVWRGATENGP